MPISSNNDDAFQLHELFFSPGKQIFKNNSEILCPIANKWVMMKVDALCVCSLPLWNTKFCCGLGRHSFI